MKTNKSIRIGLILTILGIISGLIGYFFLPKCSFLLSNCPEPGWTELIKFIVFASPVFAYGFFALGIIFLSVGIIAKLFKK